MPARDDRRDSSAGADDAIFAPVRVRTARRPRFLASLVIVALGSMIALGVVDGPAEPARDRVAVAPPEPPATTRTQIARSGLLPSQSVPGARAEQRSRPVGPLLLNVTPVGSHLWVHGDVRSLAVARVLITVEDPAGNVAATASVGIPGGSPAQRLDLTPAFNVHFFLPDEIQADGFVVSAMASDAAGATLFTVTRVMAASTRPI